MLEQVIGMQSSVNLLYLRICYIISCNLKMLSCLLLRKQHTFLNHWAKFYHYVLINRKFLQKEPFHFKFSVLSDNVNYSSMTEPLDMPVIGIQCNIINRALTNLVEQAACLSFRILICSHIIISNLHTYCKNFFHSYVFHVPCINCMYNIF